MNNISQYTKKNGILILTLFSILCIPFFYTEANNKNNTNAEHLTIKNEIEISPTTSNLNNPQENKYKKETKDITRAWVWRIVKRFQAGMDRMVKISTRIESRAKKLESEGFNINEIENNLKTARFEINKTGDNIILAAASINDIFEKNNDPADSYNKFKNYILKAKDNLKESKEILLENVRIMKGLEQKNENEK